jgi:hypothetical protein
MTDHRHYVPILKGKTAEFWALQHLKPESRPLVTPLIEVVPPGTKNEAKHLRDSATRLAQAWGGDRLFVDLRWRMQVPPAASGATPTSYFFHQTRLRDLAVVPVTAPGRPDHYQEAVRHAVQEGGRGAPSV